MTFGSWTVSMKWPIVILVVLGLAYFMDAPKSMLILNWLRDLLKGAQIK